MVGVKVQTSVRGRDRESTLRLQRVLAEPTRAGGGNGEGTRLAPAEGGEL
jgi:hypothetical protein